MSTGARAPARRELDYAKQCPNNGIYHPTIVYMISATKTGFETLTWLVGGGMPVETGHGRQTQGQPPTWLNEHHVSYR